MASAMDFADRQFSELAELQSLELEHFPGHINFENRQRSVSVVPEHRQSSVSAVCAYWEESMLLSASQLFPAGAGVVTESGSTSIEVTHVVDL